MPLPHGDALECHGGGLSKLRREAASAKVAPKLLMERHLHVRLIVNHENEQLLLQVCWRTLPHAAERSEIR